MNKNEPAFPSANEITLGEYSTTGHAGMSLRDYFAAAALTGILAYIARTTNDMRLFAADSYFIADAMLAERSKE